MVKFHEVCHNLSCHLVNNDETETWCRDSGGQSWLKCKIQWQANVQYIFSHVNTLRLPLPLFILASHFTVIWVDSYIHKICYLKNKLEKIWLAHDVIWIIWQRMVYCYISPINGTSHEVLVVTASNASNVLHSND